MNQLGKYQIIEEIGRGGMGLVYRAYDPDIDRSVAIKLISERALEIPSVKARFQREARTAGKLAHANITVVYELGEIAGQVFIVMEYLDGRDLRAIIESQPALSLGAKIDLIKQIAAGLEFAHRQGIVHRDIKPENIMVLASGLVKILDFGIAKPDTRQQGDDSGTRTVLTQEGSRIGTPWYMSPEQVRGAPVDRRSDIFSLGVLFYEFLTYRKPFDGDDTTVMYKILNVEPEPVVIHEGDLVEDMRRIVGRCLAKNAADRYPDCGALTRDLDETLEKIKKGKWIRDLLAEAQQLSLAHQDTEAMAKLSEVLQIDPNHAEAKRRIRLLGERQQESATVKIIDGRIIGQTVSHYRIIERLGGGGMGVVYKAEDTNLERPVALKFLLPELTRDEGAKKRFLTEARAASALDHPNICTVHEIDETDEGLLFLCMAYYEGDTLAARIARGVDIDTALAIIIKVAAGLARAHEHGIVHRDIKPANIMLTRDNDVKIVDFGLAKLSGATRITKTGTTMGTLPYMSPEQVRGEELDNRSDIWSLGVMLYHTLTGKLPFFADYEAAILYAILNTEPVPIRDLNSEVDEALESIVARTLKKNLVDRYQSMGELLKELSSYAKKRARSSSPHATLPERPAVRPTVERLLDDAEAFFMANRLDRALEVCGEAAKLDPDNDRLREMFANISAQTPASGRRTPLSGALEQNTVPIRKVRTPKPTTGVPSGSRRITTVIGNNKKKALAISMPAIAVIAVAAYFLWPHPNGGKSEASARLAVVTDADCILIDGAGQRVEMKAGQPTPVEGDSGPRKFEVMPRDYPVFEWTSKAVDGKGDPQALQIRSRFADARSLTVTISGNYGDPADKVEDGLVVNGYPRSLDPSFKRFQPRLPAGTYDIRFSLPGESLSDARTSPGVTQVSPFRFDFSSFSGEKAFVALAYRKAAGN